jgi:hypothetical protein
MTNAATSIDARQEPASARPLARQAWLATWEARAVTAGLAVALLVGVYLRFWLVASADFPVNDGGLFYVMTEELRHAHYAIPAYTSYNAAGIPFAYPPLGFYVAGFIADVTGSSLFSVMRLLPAVISTLTIIAFFALSSALLGSRIEGVIATFAFAVLPRTFLWFVMGGGLTRAPGLLFAVLMFHQAYLMYTRQRPSFIVTTTLCGALVVLSHGENAWFSVYTTALLLLFYGRNRRGVMHSVVVVLGVIVLTAPWWATVLHWHGPRVFLAGGEGGGYDNFSWFPLRTFLVSDEPYLPVIAALGLMGVFVCVAQRTLFLPTWILAIMLLNPRNPVTPAAVPLAMLAAIAVARLIVPRLLELGRFASHPSTGAWGTSTSAVDRWRTRARKLAPFAAVGLMTVALSGYTALGARSFLKWSEIDVLSPAERSAMQWARANSPDTSRFLVLAFTRPWFGLDATAEWFPALAQRPSVGTVQGYEWLPGRQFIKRAKRDAVLQKCKTRDVSCFENWATQSGTTVTHIYLRAERCCEVLRASLRTSPRYVRIYSGPGADIFRRVAEPAIESSDTDVSASADGTRLLTGAPR